VLKRRDLDLRTSGEGGFLWVITLNYSGRKKQALIMREMIFEMYCCPIELEHRNHKFIGP